MRTCVWIGILLLAIAALSGCGDSVSQNQANDRAAQIRAASERPEEKGTQQ